MIKVEYALKVSPGRTRLGVARHQSSHRSRSLVAVGRVYLRSHVFVARCLSVHQACTGYTPVVENEKIDFCTVKRRLAA